MKKTARKAPKVERIKGYIENAGEIVEKSVVETLEKNYMPYAMSVIVSRALPEIDGFKPSHRKLLYTMYSMGLLRGDRTKSANIVGQTMKLNPHGDASIYETMVRLARGNESLLHPFVDSKGNFGKAFSRDMSYAAARYTEARLERICLEVFDDIDKNTVDFVPNYDNTIPEPTLLPVKFPSILANPNIGIAVSMASNICSFNLAELCETTIAVMQNPDADLLNTLKAPDFPGGAFLLYDEAELRKIYETGRGSLKLRGKYSYDQSNNCIEITEIPSTTTVEAIIDKIVENVKLGKIKEISDVRDETGLSGLKIAVDLKRGVNYEQLIKRLYRLTPLQDTFSCNFNLLIEGTPQVLGVRVILLEWVNFRKQCVVRRLEFDLKKKSDKLHLLQGLAKILLDIDKAIKIIRETGTDAEVVPNLMIGFGIDSVQADYVAEIRLRHINREYILRRTEEISALQAEIESINATLASDRKIKSLIIAELRKIAETYGKPRRTMLAYSEEETDEAGDETPDYNVNLFFTSEGYFKKITPQSLRMSGEQKLKEGDFVLVKCDAANRDTLLFFTDKGNCYKSRVSEFDDTKASVMGDYIPSRLDFAPDEKTAAMIVTADYSEEVIAFFENGKCVRHKLSEFETKTNRKKLSNSLSVASPLVAMFKIDGDYDFLLTSAASKAVLFNSALITAAGRGTNGITVMRLSRGAVVQSAVIPENPKAYAKCETKLLPSGGVKVTDPKQPAL